MGLVLSTTKCEFYFIEMTTANEGKTYTTTLLSKWSPKSKVFKLDNMRAMFY